MTKIYLHKIVLLLLCLALPFGLVAQALKIMPLGNSLTQADKDHLSYRYHLWKKLLDAGAEIDFIGSQQDNYSGNPTWPAYKGKNFDRNHEGHWGWTTQHILHGTSNGEETGNLTEWLSKHKPDIVLMHLGSNDMFKNAGIPETTDRLQEIVGKLRQANPDVVILMAQLFPAHPDAAGQQESRNIPLLNAEISKLAKELHTGKSPVVLVDQHFGIDPEKDKHTYDGIHPNEVGEEKMAQRWFDALQPFLNGNPLSSGAEQLPPALSVYPTLTHGRPITIKMDSLTPGEQVNLEVLTREGKLIWQLLTAADAKGSLTYTLTPSSAHASGLYIIRASRNKKIDTARFMVAH
ncbi:SGNH/GDSL hydrolase family protein [Pontibacter beigongshangensis]|uniref:SGNH/GDSL hydrolase family protein n=1 Tax=Pontibacter beigongshangensis TaxID=2574733 RepID=UPI00164FAE65|nr:SGNH/GDSL hydrolase family protein [Pontibacter beigongshangensis]